MYIFDKDKIKLPYHIESVITRESHQALDHVLLAATDAFHQLRKMEKLRDERYRAMCSREDVAHYIQHAESVDRLFSWGQDGRPNDPTLAPAAKLSPYILHFHVDPRAYALYMHEYTAALENYINHPYRNWQKAKYMLCHVITNSNIHPIEMGEWRRWWNDTFLPEMGKWEDRLTGLLLPSWEDVVDDMYRAILERVESGKTSVDEFFISPVVVS